MADNYKIYMHKNKVNGKIYIGQTKQKLSDRFLNGEGYKKCPKFYKAIKKYGWDNFDHILLESNLSSFEANKKEIYYIEKFNSCSREKGYNISFGGAGNPRETDNIYQYSMDGYYIKTWNSVSEICDYYNIVDSGIYKCCYEEIKYFHGYQWKKYYSKKIESVMKRSDTIAKKNKKEVFQYGLDGIFIKSYPSATDAERDGFNSSRIRACCNNKIMSSYNYQWRDYYKPQIEPISDRYIRQSENSVKKVYQYTIDGIFIKEYKSLTDASKTTSLNFKNISACCNGKTKTCGGFRWSYIYKEKLPPIQIENKPKQGRQGRFVQQFLNGNLIADFVSATEAFRQTGINVANICSCCNGKLKTAGGYIWKYTS